MSKLGNGPGGAGPGVMDLIGWLEVQGVKAITVGVIPYSAVFLSNTSVREIDGQVPVEI